MRANTIRKMQVPAYCPVVLGVQSLEKSEVLMALKKTMLMPIEVSVSPPMSILMPDVAAAMPDIVEEAAIPAILEVADMSMLDTSIPSPICCLGFVLRGIGRKTQSARISIEKGSEV